MPGGRLTEQDRQRIAQGLAAGLTYTEIAGHLDRPISTISREVIRNGGAAGYQAERAQQATGARASRRRPKPATAAATSPPAGVDGRDPGAVQALEEQFTAVVVQTGLPRMSARVLTSLFLTDSASLTAAELVERLQVSPASVSKAIGQLEQQELIRRERDHRGRRDRYVIDGDVWLRSWLASARQNAMLADFADQGATLLGADTLAGARLREMGQFFAHLGRDMIQAAERWRQLSGHLPTAPPEHAPKRAPIE